MSKVILIVTDNEPNQINGVVTTFKNIKKLATANGYTIKSITPLDFPNINCPFYKEVKLSFSFNIGKLIREYNPDHIHIATEGSIGLAAKLYCDKHKLNYNTSYHTKFPEFLHKLCKVPVSWTYAYLRWFHKHSGVVLTTTKTMVDELYDHGFGGKIIPWTRGVDREQFNPNFREQHKFEKIYGLGPILLHTGRISKEKGIDDFCKLDINGTKIVVGDGPYLEELMEKYPEVKFVGSKVGRALAWYYANADVFVFTSKVDTFGVVNIESISVGTPVAAYKVPGPIDIIEEGVNGYIGDNLKENVLCCLLLDRDIVIESGKKWTWEECWEIFKNNLIEV